MGFLSKLWDGAKDIAKGDSAVGGLLFGPTGALIGEGNDKAKEKNIANYNKFASDQEQAVQRGLAQGQASAEQMYGMGLGDIGKRIKGVVEDRAAAADGKSAEAERLARTSSSQVGSARARAAATGRRLSAGEEAEIMMKGDLASQIAQQDYKRQAMGDYQDILSNIASNSQAIKMGYASLNVAPMQAPLPEKGGLSNLLGGIF